MIYKHLKNPKIGNGDEEITFIDLKNGSYEIINKKTRKKKILHGLKIGFDIKK